ncbi:putative 1-deoxy-D-xylulose-5-phosphate synthase 2, chloroplastic-like [Dorcoceras hygrometricum]|uniref:Putative 1-deoxy-D-xylulose-5-phosphate synthase 2, chloroplastic-like n=1 Tax=Dorcoceras hygrometricum TaxID=472368 RepID=A0A2Z7B010_9LAMI|nr:putative 1-deoxy-D-xylulose-5-phosphate synthase 2, chloroplastic-like [Dorcoceras hygrometricum]
MSFVKANVIYDCRESMIYDDQTSQKLNHNGKAGIGFQKRENSKPSWLKNKLDKDKAKAGRKPFVPNQPWRSSTKVKSGWKKVQPKRDLSGQSMKSKLNRSHSSYAQTLMDSYTRRIVKLSGAFIRRRLNYLAQPVDGYLEESVVSWCGVAASFYLVATMSFWYCFGIMLRMVVAAGFVIEDVNTSHKIPAVTMSADFGEQQLEN